jgi:hypothetical protein
VEPTRDEDALVEFVDVLLRDGAVVQADVVVTVADVPLVGISLRAAIAGMTTVTEYGLLDGWDGTIRAAAGGDGDDGRRPIASSAPRHGRRVDGRDRDRDSVGTGDGEPARKDETDDAGHTHQVTDNPDAGRPADDDGA